MEYRTHMPPFTQLSFFLVLRTLFIYFNIKIKYFSIQFLVLRYSMSRRVLLASMKPLRHWSRNAYPRQSKCMSLPTLCRKKGVAFPTISFPRSRFSRRQIDRMDWTQDSGAYTRSHPRLARSSLPRLSPRPMKEETSCGSGSIFRVRWCNKKQSSQRGVDRRWRGRPRLVRWVDNRLSALSRPFLYLSLAVCVFRESA